MEKQKILDILNRLLGLSFYILAAGVAFSNSFTEIATAAIIILWIAGKIISKDYSVPGGKITFILIFFVIWNLASFINTSYIYESARGLFKAIKHALLFMATIDYFKSKREVERFLLFALGVGFLICINGMVQYSTGIDLIRQRTIDSLDSLHRVSSSFGHSNDFGAYLIVVISMLLSLFFSRLPDMKKRILLLLITLPALFCLGATSSRGAWLGFIIAVLLMALAKSKRLFAAIIILFLISPLFLPDSIKNRFADLAKMQESGGTIWERKKLWSGTLAMVKEHPVLGFGINTYTKIFPTYKPSDYPDFRYTHNSYLQMASEIGAVGSGIFLLFLISVIISTAKNIGALKKGLSRDLSFGIITGLAGFLVHCGVDTHLYSVTLAAFLYLCLGLNVAFRNISYEERY